MVRRRSEQGFSLATLLFMLTAAVILAAAAIPAYQLQAQREIEEELIFRGEEYTRAIGKFQRRFPGMYPPSVDALLETNGLRFLRRAYKDPITGEAFRIITINPDGTINGSKLFQQRINNAPLFGGSNPQMFGQNPGPQNPSAPASGQPGFGQPPPGPPTQGRQQGAQQTGGQPSGPQAQGRGAGQTQNRQGQPQAFGSQPMTFGSAGLIGVASDSEDVSVKVYNNRQKYDEWEFIFVPQVMNPAQAGQFQGQGMPTPGQGGQPMPGGPGQGYPGQGFPGQNFPGQGQRGAGQPFPGSGFPGQQQNPAPNANPFGSGQYPPGSPFPGTNPNASPPPGKRPPG